MKILMRKIGLSDPGVILGGIIVFSPLVGNCFRGLDGTIPIFLATILCCGLLINDTIKRKDIHVSNMDLCFALYIGYVFFRQWLVKEQLFDPVTLCEWICIVSVYMLTRNLNEKSIRNLPYFVLISGVIQACIGIGQYGNILPSGHPAFKITGSFFNPGPYGGYVAISMITGMEIWKRNRFRLKDKGSIFLFLLLLLSGVLILSDSRAAWTAVIVAACVMYIERPFRHSCRKKHYKVITIIFIILFIGLSYLYKRDSADARLLTWSASLSMFFDSPLIGHGIGSFPAKFMLYQANFLDARPNSDYSLMADNNLLAFNEYIRLACEQGITGLLLFLIVTGKALLHSGRKAIPFRHGLIGLAVFAFFSYPASIFPLKLYFPLFVGLSAKYAPCSFRFSFRPVFKCLCLLLLILCCLFDLRTHSVYRKAFGALGKGTYLKVPFDDKEWLYLYMRHNRCFLYLLSEQFLKNDCPEKTLIVKKHLLRIAPTSSLLCDIGMLHLQKHDVDSAKRNFQFALRMTPNHITPAYGLFLAAKESGEKEQRLLWAQRIMNMPVRIVNSMVLKAKNEARACLKESGQE